MYIYVRILPVCDEKNFQPYVKNVLELEFPYCIFSILPFEELSFSVG